MFGFGDKRVRHEGARFEEEERGDKACQMAESKLCPLVRMRVLWGGAREEGGGGGLGVGWGFGEGIGFLEKGGQRDLAGPVYDDDAGTL